MCHDLPRLRNLSGLVGGGQLINGRTDIQNELSSVLYMEFTTVKETELSMSQTLL